MKFVKLLLTVLKEYLSYILINWDLEVKIIKEIISGMFPFHSFVFKNNSSWNQQFVVCEIITISCLLQSKIKRQ